MSVAIRTITDLKFLDDVNVTVGAGVDEYALCWDNDTNKFVLRAMAATGGLLATGATVGATAQAQAFTNGIVGPTWKPSANSTTALQLQNAAGASIMNVDTTNGRVGIGTTAPGYVLHTISSTSEIVAMVESTFSGSSSANYGFKRFSGQDWRLGVNANDDFRLRDETAGRNIFIFENGAPASSFYMTSAGRVGIGTAAPASALDVVLNDATTNAVVNVLTIGHENATVTTANGFGAGQLFTLESSTTTAQSAARIQALWYEATHATRKADLVLTAYDSGGEREGLRIRGNGSGPAIAFLGAPPAARVAHVADPAGGGTVDAEARSAINSILVTLETFGLHATS